MQGLVHFPEAKVDFKGLPHFTPQKYLWVHDAGGGNTCLANTNQQLTVKTLAKGNKQKKNKRQK